MPSGPSTTPGAAGASPRPEDEPDSPIRVPRRSPAGRAATTSTDPLLAVRPAGVRSTGPGESGTSGNGGPPAGPGARGVGEKPGEEKKRFSFLRELPILLAVAFLLALLIKTFLIQAFYIPSQSMEPTLQIGDRVLVNKVVYHLHPPRRGDVIVFEDPHPVAEPDRNPVSAFWNWLTQGLGLSANPEKDFIKRVVALPGETIEIRGGVVFIDGRELDEPYLPRRGRDLRDYPPTRVPEESLFVMGDNRPNSNDSRFSLRFIPYDRVIGRAFVMIWPPSRIGRLN